MPRSSSLLFACLVGLVGLAALPRPAAAFTPDEAKASMTVMLVRSDAADCGADCPEWLAMTGKIGPGTPALLTAALARLGPRRVPVLVDSPGGVVEAAMAMGRAIRARRLDVVVAGTALTDCGAADRACETRRRAGEPPGFVAGGVAICASACSLLLAAGTDRAVGPNSYVGVHQMSSRRTVTRVINTFRILKRVVGGRAVEISRTLVATRPVSSRVIQGAAPEVLYSAVDRYLLGMGVKEAIMPLMRSATPSDIHWMTPSELAATQIATDTTDARTLVARAAEPKPAGTMPTSAMALAAAALGASGRAAGIVDWRIDRAPGGPTLVGTVDIPERHLHGSVSIRRQTEPGSTDGFVAAVDLGASSAIEPGRVWTVEAPKICDPAVCTLSFAPVATRDDGQGRREFGVIPAWGDTFLSVLRDRDWLTFGLSADDASQGWVSLSLTAGARAVVAAWEHACCGLAAAAPSPGGPAIPTPPAPTRPAATGHVASESRATFSLRDQAGSAPPFDGTVALAWTPLTPLDRPSPPGVAALRATLTIPGDDVHLTVEVSRTGDPALVALTFAVDATPAHFGPGRTLSIAPVWNQDGHVALQTETAGPAQGSGRSDATLSVHSDVADGASLSVEIDDLLGHRLSVHLPTDGAMQMFLRRIGKGTAAGS